jgi:hypothetical protein
VIHGDPPRVFIAESETVLGRVLALLVVAQTDPAELRDQDQLKRVREALLEERWGDAVAGWMTDVEAVDGYPDEVVWTNELLDREQAAMEIRMAPIFGSRNAQSDEPK